MNNKGLECLWLQSHVWHTQLLCNISYPFCVVVTCYFAVSNYQSLERCCSSLYSNASIARYISAQNGYIKSLMTGLVKPTSNGDVFLRVVCTKDIRASSEVGYTQCQLKWQPPLLSISLFFTPNIVPSCMLYYIADVVQATCLLA